MNINRARLTKCELAWSHEVPPPRPVDTGTVTLYRVDGLPPGQHAHLRTPDLGLTWQILRGRNDIGERFWDGKHATADDALRVLQSELDSEEKP
jgi:hypothetical protein